MLYWLKKIFSQAAVILLILLTIAFYDVVFFKKTFKVTTANSQALPNGVYGQTHNKPSFIPVNGTDSSVLEEPIYEFIKQNLKKGIFPLWNPHQACGFPLIGMLQVGMFYPLTFLMYIFPSLYAWDILIFVRLLLAGILTFWFMQTLGFKKIPSLSAAIAFMLSGPMVLLQYWTANVDILTPLLLVAMERLIRQTKPQNIILLALIVCLTIFGGHPEHIFLVNAYGVSFFIFRLISLRKETNYKKVVLFLLYSYALGLGLSAIAFFPFLYNFILEFWHGHPPGAGILMEEQRSRALSLILPHFFQKEPLTFQWSFAGWWGGYLGTLPFALAFLSLFKKQKKGLNYFFAALAFILIGKEYGLPVINGLGHLPLFNLPRYAIHSPPLVAFSVSVLAGMGVHAVQTNKNNFWKACAFTLSLMVIIILYFTVFKTLPTFVKENPAFRIPLALQATFFALILLIVFQAVLWLKDKKRMTETITGIILIGLIFTELFCYIHRQRPYRFNSFAKVPYIELLKSSQDKIRAYGNFWAFYPNTATGFGVDDLGYFFGLVPKRFVYFVNHLLVPNHFKANFNPPALRAYPIQGKDDILNLLNVKYIITPATDTLSKMFPHFENPASRLPNIYAKEVKIYNRPLAFPRSFIVHKALFAPKRQNAFALIKELGPRLRYVGVINHSPINTIIRKLKTLPIKDASTSHITRYTPNEVIIEAQLENDGFLILSDAYHPDWKAFANGKEIEVYQTDYLLRSVFLPKGKHTIKFVFKPFSFYLGLITSLFSLILVCFIFVTSRIKEKARV